MSMMEDVADYLELAGVGTVGTNIFKGNMPDSPDQCITVYAYAGETPDLSIDIERPGLQVKSRALTAEDALDLAEHALAHLHKATSQTINGVLYYYIHALQSPIHLGRDEKGRYMYSVNYNVVKEL